MITDEMLQTAAELANDALLSTLPDSDNCKHEFSKRFNRKMNKLIRHTKYHYFYTFLKAAAYFIVVTLLSATLFLTVNVKARGSFFTWLKEKYDLFIEYYFDGLTDNDITQNKMAEYRLGWLPDGYVESEVSIATNDALIIYTNENNSSIRLNYINTPNASSIFFEDEAYTHSTTILDGINADIYISNTNDNYSFIVWTNKENTILFTISAYTDKLTLIKLAENTIISNTDIKK